MFVREPSLYTTSVVVVAVACAVVACGGSASTAGPPSSDGGPAADASGSGSDGGSGSVDSGGLTDASDPAARSQAILTLNGGAAAGCISVPPMTVGDFGDQTAGTAPRPVVSGEIDRGKVVTVTCRTAPIGGGFELQASIAVAGDASLTFQGTLDAQGKTTAGSLVLEKGATTWTSATCSADPSTLLPVGGVAAGRYWALFSCGGAASNTAATCDLFGQIRLENCEQQ